MTTITQLDIDRLRQRMLGAADRAAVPPAAPQPAFGDSAPPSALAGDVREGPLGKFLVQERFYSNRQLHGNIPIEQLQTISAKWLEDVSNGAVPAASPRRWAFLDTETTGLAGGTGTCTFLVGVGAIEEDGFRVRLFFMRDYDEEAAMLSALAGFLDDFDAVLTYNGKTFDVPLLKTRFRLMRQRNPFDRLSHLDLLHPARRLWGRRMPDCKLGTLESKVLGLERENDVPGAFIPERYFRYLRSRDARGLRPVFHHNVLDIVSLACLASVLMAAYAAPGDTSTLQGEDMLGMAHWLRQSGNEEQALDLYRKAIEAGLPDSGLFVSLWESAQIERRAGNQGAHLRLLGELARVSNTYRAAAFEALAKHYEHKEKDYERALEMTRSAQRHAPSDALRHRERRLVRKAGASAERVDLAPADARDAGSLPA